MTCECKNGLFHLRVRTQHFGKRRGTGRAKREAQFQFLSPWEGTSEKPNDFLSAVNPGRRLPRRTTKPCQETRVSCNAIADGAKAGQINEEAFLKKGWQGIIEVCGLSKSPKFLSDLGCFGRKAKEIWQHAEPLFNPRFQVRRAIISGFRVF